MKRRELTEEERALWLEENGQRPKTIRKKQAGEAKQVLPKKAAPAAPLEIGDTKGLDKKRVAARPEAVLDLHGLTQDSAHARVKAFIIHSASEELRTLLIITGKGSGVLRKNLPKWLDAPQLRPFILAVTYANPKEGGEGALRVLLKKRKT